MRTAGLNVYSRVVKLDNGVVIECHKCFEREDLFIHVPPAAGPQLLSGFLSNPRILGVYDGYRLVGEVLEGVGAGATAYPFGSVLGTTVRIQINTDTGIPNINTHRDVLEYGNIDWKGRNTALSSEPSNAPVLTWKGPTGRTVAFNPDVEITGLTTPDIVFGEGSDKFTCFGPHIYTQGRVAFTIPTLGDSPPKVLGAAYQAGVLVCIVNDHYADQIGFFEEVWVKKGVWKKLYSRSGVGRPMMIWAFNQSGTRATQGVSEYTINAVTEEVAFDAGENNVIVLSIDKASDKTTYSGEAVVWSDYKGDERVFATVTASGGHQRMFNSAASHTETQAQIYVQGVKPPVTLAITGPDAYGGPGAYSVVGNSDVCCDDINPIVWSYPTGCGVDLVRATTACGDVLEKEVRMPAGVWTLTGSCATSCGLAATPVEYIQGTTKITEVIADVWGGPNSCGVMTVDIWNEPGPIRCQRGIQLNTCTYYDITLNCGSSCGGPTVPYTPSTTDPAPTTGSYEACIDNANGGTVTYSITHQHVVGVLQRRTYTWSCPP